MEEINSLSQLPLGMRTYIADSVCIMGKIMSLMFIIISLLYKATKRSNDYIQLHYTTLLIYLILILIVPNLFTEKFNKI